jgi:hypothetical protein
MTPSGAGRRKNAAPFGKFQPRNRFTTRRRTAVYSRHPKLLATGMPLIFVAYRQCLRASEFGGPLVEQIDFRAAKKGYLLLCSSVWALQAFSA